MAEGQVKASKKIQRTRNKRLNNSGDRNAPAIVPQIWERENLFIIEGKNISQQYWTCYQAAQHVLPGTEEEKRAFVALGTTAENQGSQTIREAWGTCDSRYDSCTSMQQSILHQDGNR